jgi:DHA1 family tetracycline resistance protein-like MFS transporter
MFYFFQPLYLQELGADPQQIGLILGTVLTVMAVSYLPAGILSDRFGRRPVIHSAWIIATLATVIMAFAPSLPVFIIGMMIYGMTGYVTVPLNSYATAARGSWSVGRTITLLSACFNLGYIAGGLLGGWVGEQFSLQTSFRIAMFIFGVSTAVILMIQPQPVERAAPQPGEAAAERRGLRALDGRFLRFVALMFVVFFGLYISQPLTQNFLQNVRGMDHLRIGQLISIRSVGIVVLSLALGQLNPRVGFLLAQIAMAFFNLFIWKGYAFPAYLTGYFLMGSYQIARNLAIAQSRTLVKSGNMGMAYGVLETAISLSMVLGAPLAGFLYQRQPDWMYFAGLGLVSAGLAANWLLSPVHRKDLQAFEEKEKAEWAGL